MKIKYKYIGNLLIREEDCIAYLEKMAVQGWKLKKIGLIFLKFKYQGSQQLKYQLDYNFLTDEYLEVLSMNGYHLVDSYRDISIFSNENCEVEDLNTDKVSRLMVLKERYKLLNIIILIVCALVLVICSDFYGLFELLVRPTIGSYLLNINWVIIHWLSNITAGIFMLEAIGQVLIRWDIHQQLNDNKSIDKYVKYFYNLLQIIYFFLIAVWLIFIFNIIIYKPLSLVGLGLYLICFTVYNYYINKKLYQEKNIVIKRIKIVGSIVLFVVVSSVINLNSDEQDAGLTSDYQDAPIVSSEVSKSLLVTCSSIYGIDKNREKSIFYETRYTCLNDYLATEVFKELICQTERDTRIPSDEEIEQISEATGSWSISDVKYLDYQEVIKKFELIETSYADICYRLNDELLAIKSNQVLLLKVKEGINFEDVLKGYLS